MKFRTVLQLRGKTATGIRLPDEIVAAMGAGKKLPVKVTIGHYTYQSTVAAMGGVFMIPVSAEHRAGAGITAGQEIEVILERDDAPREIAVPADFQEMLERNADAKTFFEGLSNSNKRRLVDPIEQAKTAETRQRRMEKALAQLQDGRIL